jgi:hypothetical protein
MKRNLLLSSLLLVAAVVIVSGIALMSTAYSASNITVLNPAVTEKLAARAPLQPRLDTMDGKTLYLVDMNYEGIGGTPVMKEMQAWFTKNMPKVKAVYKLKRGNYVDDDPALWKEIAEKGGDGVIMGVAG